MFVRFKTFFIMILILSFLSPCDMNELEGHGGGRARKGRRGGGHGKNRKGRGHKRRHDHSHGHHDDDDDHHDHHDHHHHDHHDDHSHHHHDHHHHHRNRFYGGDGWNDWYDGDDWNNYGITYNPYGDDIYNPYDYNANYSSYPVGNRGGGGSDMDDDSSNFRYHDTFSVSESEQRFYNDYGPNGNCRNQKGVFFNR